MNFNSAQECRIRWLGYWHPQIDRSSWSPDEIQKLKDVLADLRNGQKATEGEGASGDKNDGEGSGNADDNETAVDWVLVSKRLGVRSNLICGLPII